METFIVAGTRCRSGWRVRVLGAQGECLVSVWAAEMEAAFRLVEECLRRRAGDSTGPMGERP